MPGIGDQAQVTADSASVQRELSALQRRLMSAAPGWGSMDGAGLTDHMDLARVGELMSNLANVSSDPYAHVQSGGNFELFRDQLAARARGMTVDQYMQWRAEQANAQMRAESVQAAGRQGVRAGLSAAQAATHGGQY